MKDPVQVAVSVLLGIVLLAPCVHAADQQHVARPGTVNYVEGQANLGAEALTQDSLGNAELDAGQKLTTQNGKAEVLLAPGIFFRIGDASVASMISAGPGNTRLSLDQGEAFLEVDEIHPENDLRILQNGIAAQPVKMGLYNFNANLRMIRVLDGELIVDDEEKSIHVKAGHLIDLSKEPFHVRKFDKAEVESEDLYRWTSLRSSFLAEANADYAPTYSMGGFGWFGDGWYWDPWFDSYTFLPGAGIFYSSFGWGFYSPWCAMHAPFFWGSHSHHHFSPTAHATWGAEAHYKSPTNLSHGVPYASYFSAHGPVGGSKMGGLHAGGSHSGWGHGFSSAFHGAASMGGGHR